MKIELLLEKVRNFLTREAERKKYTGEDFNIFEILGIGHLEAIFLIPKGLTRKEHYSWSFSLMNWELRHLT